MTTVDTIRSTMTGYIETLVERGPFARFFAPDIWLQLMGTDQEAHGREAVEAIIRYFHEQAFDMRPELKNLLVDGERGALEADFVGRHVAEFSGRVATGREVRVPYSVHYELHGDQITALRIYLPLELLLRQIDGKND